MKAYKIVRTTLDGKRVSFLAGCGEVEYIPGQAAVPVEGNGPLCVFRTLEQCHTYLQDWEIPHEIWICDCTRSRAETQWYTTVDGYRETGYSWQGFEGAVLVDSVTLLGEVYA